MSFSRESVTRSPLKSPSKRGIMSVQLRPQSPSASVVLSPVKTPSGRAGLASPLKRSSSQLDQSAKKRAIVNSKAYAKLMVGDEEEGDFDEDNEYLNYQDDKLAEAIIKQSRNEDADTGTAYGSDVEFEEDLTEVHVKPKRNITRRKVLVEVDDDEGDDSDDAIVHLESSDNELELSDDSDDEYSRPKRRRKIESIQPAKRTRTRSTPKTSPSKVFLSDASPSPSPTPKRKVGRPSKATELIGKIKSIFHMDDEEFFQENKSPVKKQAQKGGRAFNDDSDGGDDFDIFSQTLGSISTDVNTTAPIISGISRKIGGKEVDDSSFAKKFEPMPIPKVNVDGTIQDEDFINKYIKPMADIKHFRLADDGAIFMEGTEGYFEQHSVRSRASGNSLSQFAPPLEYSEFIPYVKLGQLFQNNEKKILYKLHTLLYHQWCFELSQGFNLNFYGTGSKRELLLSFLEDFFFKWYEDCWDRANEPQVLVVNGYNPAVKFKQIVGDIVSVFIPQEKRKKDNIRFPKHVLETVPFLVNYIESKRGTSTKKISPKVILAIHSIDGPGLRDEKTQSLLSQLCSIPEIWLVSSSDNINVSLLWDLYKLKNFNFIFHDLTTYDSFNTEVSFKDILSMGRSTKHNGNKGAKYVLSSLTMNAKNLYRVLLTKQLAVMKEQPGSNAARNILKGTIKLGIEFKSFYNACLEEFITSNEISFRTILGEFMEHKMCNLVKDDSGTEIVFIPFSYSEMEKLLQEF